MVIKEKVYVGIGANLGNPVFNVQLACKKISSLSGVSNMTCSRFYQTKPVGPNPQNDFINAVCRFETTLSLPSLGGTLQAIEKALGKRQKSKHAPRMIDLDVLFYGHESFSDETFEIPHPKWKERLFVLLPLLDLTKEIFVSDSSKKLTCYSLPEIVKNFSNIHEERVSLLL